MAELTETMDQAVRAMAAKEGKYLTFSMAKMEGGVKILLDIDRVLSVEEVSVLEQAA